MNFAIMSFVPDMELAIPLKESIKTIPVNILLPKNSFSESINQLIISCSATMDIMIFCSHRMRPTHDDIIKMLKLIIEGYGLVSFYNFEFFGFKIELIRRIGFFDERFILDGYEANDFYIRLCDANISIYQEDITITHPDKYISSQSLWDNSENKQATNHNFFKEKWHFSQEGIKRNLPEVTYYNIGPSDTNITFIKYGDENSIKSDYLITKLKNAPIESLKTIGFVVNQYHTELLDYLIEIYIYLGCKVIIYNIEDNYNNLPFLFVKYSPNILIKNINDFINDICFKYIILTDLEYIYDKFKDTYYNDSIIYVPHIPKQLELIKENPQNNYFGISKCISNECAFPVVNIKNNYINFQDTINVIKIGWVNTSLETYKTLLQSKKIKLHIFTGQPTDHIISLLEEYGDYVDVFYQKKSEFIYSYINNYKIKFVLYCQNNTDLWSGSISFALDNNLILLTTQNVIDCYKIPNDYCISYENENYITEMKIKDYNANPEALKEYKEKIFLNNVNILHKVTFT